MSKNISKDDILVDYKTLADTIKAILHTDKIIALPYDNKISKGDVAVFQKKFYRATIDLPNGATTIDTTQNSFVPVTSSTSAVDIEKVKKKLTVG